MPVTRDLAGRFAVVEALSLNRRTVMGGAMSFVAVR